jgi:hypothetical protein
MKKSKYNKKGGCIVTREYILYVKSRYLNTEWSLPKYLQLIERAMDVGFEVSLYDYPRSPSKYVTLLRNKKKFTIRFSNHKPLAHLEEKGTCDFFVGVTNLGVTTTKDAWNFAMKHFDLYYSWGD